MKDLIKTMDFESAYDIAHNAALNMKCLSFQCIIMKLLLKTHPSFQLPGKDFGRLINDSIE